MPIHKLLKRRKCTPVCRGPWKPVGKLDRLGRGNRWYPMKECKVCGHRS